jgi:hypothetical protein
LGPMPDHTDGGVAVPQVLSNIDVTAQSPHKYQSITGKTRQEGGSLTYEENVVYSSHAAIPSYLIVYKLARD